jgi:rubrerythrin
MTKLQQQATTIPRLMENYEEAVSRLYKAYAECFPQQKDLWHKLALEEIEHADWLRVLCERIEDGTAHFGGILRADAGEIETALEQVQQELKKTKTGHLRPADALLTAMHLESSLLEAGWLTPFKGDSPELKRVLQALTEDTGKHTRALRKLLQVQAGESKPAAYEARPGEMRKLV